MLFSILEIIPTSFFINLRVSNISFSSCKYDKAIQLQPSLRADLISFLSFLVSLLKDNSKFGMCILLLLLIKQL